MFHQTLVLGNLGRDPELREVDGREITNFSVAANNVYTSNGVQIEETTWYRVSVFGKQARACAEYLRKGRSVLVVGRLRPDAETGGPRVYIRDDGTAGAQFELTAQTVKFVGRGDEELTPVAGGPSDEFDLPWS